MSKMVKYIAYNGKVRTQTLSCAMSLIDSVDVKEAFERLMVLLVEKGEISLEDAATVIKDDSIVGWAEDENE
jgi:hypothetical protein